VQVTVVLIDKDNKVLTGDETVDVLSNSNTQEKLMDMGVDTDEFTAGMRIINVVINLNNYTSLLAQPATGNTKVEDDDDDDDDGLSGGAIAGIVIGVICGAFIVVVVVVVVFVTLQKRGSSDKGWNDG